VTLIATFSEELKPYKDTFLVFLTESANRRTLLCGAKQFFILIIIIYYNIKDKDY